MHSASNSHLDCAEQLISELFAKCSQVITRVHELTPPRKIEGNVVCLLVQDD